MYVNGRICFGSATPTCLGNHESLEAGGALLEVNWKWMWLRWAHRKGRKSLGRRSTWQSDSSFLSLSFVCFACVMTA